MVEKFVIKSLNLEKIGYYDSVNKSFEALKQATRYDTYDDAKTRIEKLDKGVYQIDKVFIV